MPRLCDRRVLLILLLIASSALHIAARQGLIDVRNGYAEFVNTNLFLLCGILCTILHFVRIGGGEWYFGMIGLSMAIMPFPGFRTVNLGLLFITSTVLVIFVETVFCRSRAIHQRATQEEE